MKKLALLFVSAVALSALSAYALDKKCYKRCMERLDDHSKCHHICTYDEAK